MFRNSLGPRQPFKPPARKSMPPVVEPSPKTVKIAKVEHDFIFPDIGPSFSEHKAMVKVKDEISMLNKKIKAMKKKGHQPEQLKEYIGLLHGYNFRKDFAQLCMGRVAVWEFATYKEISARYGAPLATEDQRKLYATNRKSLR